MATDLDYVPGYPVDARGRRLPRAAPGFGPLGDFEYAAGRVVARFTGERVVLQDDGSRDRMPDIVIEYRHRPQAFVEVVADLEPAYAATWAETVRRKQLIDAPSLGRVWFLVLSSKAVVKNFERAVIPLLAELEAAGDYFERALTSHFPETTNPTALGLRDFGIVNMSSCPAPRGEPGAVRLFPDGVTGPAQADWDNVLAWLGGVLVSDRLKDVRAKLGDTGAAERHLFLGVTFSSRGDVVMALAYGEPTLPVVAPSLPPEVTHLWVWSLLAGGRCSPAVGVWRGFRTGGGSTCPAIGLRRRSVRRWPSGRPQS